MNGELGLRREPTYLIELLGRDKSVTVRYGKSAATTEKPVEVYHQSPEHAWVRMDGSRAAISSRRDTVCSPLEREDAIIIRCGKRREMEMMRW